jgi:hypothetical protein
MKLAKTIAYTFYLQLSLCAIGAIILLQNRNANNFSGLEAFLFIIPAVILIPIVVLMSAVCAAKGIQLTRIVYAALLINLTLGFFLFYRIGITAKWFLPQL